MEPVTGSCPFEEAVRAARCNACCTETALPPCAIGWLKARLGAAPVTVLRAERPGTKAA